jgi:hypothetical protein
VLYFSIGVKVLFGSTGELFLSIEFKSIVLKYWGTVFEYYTVKLLPKRYWSESSGYADCLMTLITPRTGWEVLLTPIPGCRVGKLSDPVKVSKAVLAVLLSHNGFCEIRSSGGEAMCVMLDTVVEARGLLQVGWCPAHCWKLCSEVRPCSVLKARLSTPCHAQYPRAPEQAR